MLHLSPDQHVSTVALNILFSRPRLPPKKIIAQVSPKPGLWIQNILF